MQEDINAQKDNEEYEGNWKRRKVTHSEDEDGADSKKARELDRGDSPSTAKETDGNEKYDPLEADAESDDENQQVDEEKSSADKMWADMDNDVDIEIGNLLEDDTSEERNSATDSPKITPKLEQQKATAAVKPVTHTPRGRGGYRSRGNRARRSRR